MFLLCRLDGGLCIILVRLLEFLVSLCFGHGFALHAERVKKLLLSIWFESEDCNKYEMACIILSAICYLN